MNQTMYPLGQIYLGFSGHQFTNLPIYQFINLPSILCPLHGALIVYRLFCTLKSRGAVLVSNEVNGLAIDIYVLILKHIFDI